MAESNHIKKIAIVGAGGNCGKYVTEALLAKGTFNVSAITRQDSTTQLLPGVNPKRVDYDDHSSLVEALKGQDMLIIFMTSRAPKEHEENLIKAAADADVPWILPNDWALNMRDESMSKDTLVGDAKKKTRGLIKSLGKSSFIAVETSFWYEFSLAIPLAYGFDFAKRTVTLFDDGNAKISTSTWPQVGRAVANLASIKVHRDNDDDSSPCLDQFKNDFVFVSSFTISQNDMLESVLRVTGDKVNDWSMIKEPSRERYDTAVKQMKDDFRTGFVKAMYTRVFFPDDSGNFEKTCGLHNELLSLPKEDLDQYTGVAIERSKNPLW